MVGLPMQGCFTLWDGFTKPTSKGQLCKTSTHKGGFMGRHTICHTIAFHSKGFHPVFVHWKPISVNVVHYQT